MSQLKTILTLSFLFFFGATGFVYAQNAIDLKTLMPKSYDSEDYVYGEPMKGAIKKVTTKSYAYTFNEIDSTYTAYEDSILEKDVFVEENEICEYDQNGHLLRRSFIGSDGEILPQIQQAYTTNGLLLSSIKHTQVYGDDFSQIIGTHKKEEKRIYTEHQKLKEVWLKSSYQDAYFIKERYTYTNDTLLSKYESFNSDVKTEHLIPCNGGFPNTDYVFLYTYDQKNRLIEKKGYTYEYEFDENNEELISQRDFSEYKLASIHTYQYNEQNVIVKEVKEYLNNFLGEEPTITVLDYDEKGRVVSDISSYGTGRKSGYKYEYHEDGDGLINVTIFHITYEKNKNKKVTKRLWSIIEKTEQGYKEEYFEDDIVIAMLSYSQYGDETHRKDFIYKEQSSYQYRYDKHGNWTSKTSFQNGIKTEKTTRVLEYY